jgi:hypothetical protein
MLTKLISISSQDLIRAPARRSFGLIGSDSRVSKPIEMPRTTPLLTSEQHWSATLDNREFEPRHQRIVADTDRGGDADRGCGIVLP